MALIKCPDCGKMISDSAKTCIGCGRPMKKEPLPDDPMLNDVLYGRMSSEEYIRRKCAEDSVKLSYEKHGWLPFLW